MDQAFCFILKVIGTVLELVCKLDSTLNQRLVYDDGINFVGAEESVNILFNVVIYQILYVHSCKETLSNSWQSLDKHLEHLVW